jgi:hypothetical protein
MRRRTSARKPRSHTKKKVCGAAAARINHVNWIVGGTLTRVSSPIGMTPGSWTPMQFRRATAKQQRQQCDRCRGHVHAATSTTCAGAFGEKSHMVHADGIYDIVTGKHVGYIEITNVTRGKRLLRGNGMGRVTLF